MKTLGNIIWIFTGGLLSATAWGIVGCLWCITIIGIPVGTQCFKMASLSFMPFGKTVIYGGGAMSFIVNILWICLSGVELALGFLMLGVFCCATIIGIPFGLQFFKFAKLALMPFGAEVR